MNKPYTTETWVKAVKERWQYDYDYSKVEYKGSKNKVCIICNELDENGIPHGEFWQEANSHLHHGKRCPKCHGNFKKTTEQFIKEAKKIHGNKYDYSKFDYKGNKKPGIIICPIHGEFTQQPVHHIQQKSGCPKCNLGSIGITKTLEQFIKDAKEVHGDKYNYSKSEYIHSHTPLTIICPEHGDFQQSPNSHLQGKGCPRCILKSQTKIFQKLKKSFPEVEFIWEYKSEWLGEQRIDIFLPEYNIAIEYNGEQHYFPVEVFGGEERFQLQIQQDELKIEKCKNNQVDLLIIKYDNEKEDLEAVCEAIKTKIESINCI